jgi:alanine racemase
MAGDTGPIRDHSLIPVLNSPAQARRHFDALPGHGFGIQIDTGMNRLGMAPEDWQSLAPEVVARGARLVMSHLACAEDVDHCQNDAQLRAFCRMTDGIALPRSLAATAGILLGAAYHFDLTRPGIGLYGGAPFAQAMPVVALSLPIVQVRDADIGATVGYAASWTAKRPMRIATLLSGYADGILRNLSNRAVLWHGNTPCPVLGRVSMDVITVDVTALHEVPESLEVLGPAQGIDALAAAAGTIGHEVLTGLGARLRRSYTGAQ